MEMMMKVEEEINLNSFQILNNKNNNKLIVK